MNNKMSKAYLHNLQNALKEHMQLKNDLQAQKLTNLGLYQQAVVQQKPVTDAIAESKDIIRRPSKQKVIQQEKH